MTGHRFSEFREETDKQVASHVTKDNEEKLQDYFKSVGLSKLKSRPKSTFITFSFH